jgi:Zn-finger nucleic acid-binding protein
LTDDDVNKDILRSHGIEVTEREVPELDYCPQCGIQIEPIMTYCANCGQRLDIVREKPQWFDDLREELGEDDSLVEYFLQNQHHLVESIEELPQRLYSRVQTYLESYMKESGKATIGESFIYSHADIQDVEDELSETLDDFTPPENPEPGGTATIETEDGYEIDVPASEVMGIWDDIAKLEKLTETEYIAYDESGSAIQIISILEERHTSKDEEEENSED